MNHFQPGMLFPAQYAACPRGSRVILFQFNLNDRIGGGGGWRFLLTALHLVGRAKDELIAWPGFGGIDGMRRKGENAGGWRNRW